MGSSHSQYSEKVDIWPTTLTYYTIAKVKVNSHSENQSHRSKLMVRAWECSETDTYTDTQKDGSDSKFKNDFFSDNTRNILSHKVILWPQQLTREVKKTIPLVTCAVSLRISRHGHCHIQLKILPPKTVQIEILVYDCVWYHHTYGIYNAPNTVFWNIPLTNLYKEEGTETSEIAAASWVHCVNLSKLLCHLS